MPEQVLRFSFLSDFAKLCAQVEGYDEAAPLSQVLIWAHDYSEKLAPFVIPLDEDVPLHVQLVRPDLLEKIAKNLDTLSTIANQLASVPESNPLAPLAKIVEQLGYGDKCREIRDQARDAEITIDEVFLSRR